MSVMATMLGRVSLRTGKSEKSLAKKSAGAPGSPRMARPGKSADAPEDDLCPAVKIAGEQLISFSSFVCYVLSRSAARWRRGDDAGDSLLLLSWCIGLASFHHFVLRRQSPNGIQRQGSENHVPMSGLTCDKMR